MLVTILQCDTSDFKWLGGLLNASLNGNFIALEEKALGFSVQMYKSIFSKTNNRTIHKICVMGEWGGGARKLEEGETEKQAEVGLELFLALGFNLT